MYTRFLFVLTLLISSCQSSPAIETVDLEGWRTERIALPPEFAPSLPAGQEVLLFAPGMFAEGAEDYWSYVFLMQIEEVGIQAERLDEILEAYFDGLIRTVAEDRGEDVGTDPATVHVREVRSGSFEAGVRLIDPFVTLEPVHLRVLIEVESSEESQTTLGVRASPQPSDHAIWIALEAALDSLTL